MIAARELVVRYRGRSAPAVDGVSFLAPAGRITAIAGPNGSGKSTIVRALLGRVTPASGAVLVGDQVVDAAGARVDRRALARRLAVVTQREEPVFPLRVRDYVALGRYPHGHAWSAESGADRSAVARALGRAEVDPLAERRTDELSGGEWQRVRIARALAQEAGALVLDEPTTFLDVAHEMAVFELLATLASDGIAVLLVSHQLNLVARFADQVVLLHRGRVAAAGTPVEVMHGATLEAVYEWPLVVTRDPAVGAPTLVPLRGRGRA